MIMRKGSQMSEPSTHVQRSTSVINLNQSIGQKALTALGADDHSKGLLIIYLDDDDDDDSVLAYLDIMQSHASSSQLQ